MWKLYFDCSSAQPIKNIKINGGGEYSIRILVELLNRLTDTEGGIVIGLDNNKGENEFITTLCDEKKYISIFKFDSVHCLNEFLSTENFNLIYFPIFYPMFSDMHIKNGVKVLGAIHDMSSYSYALIGYQPRKYVKQDHLNWMRYVRDALTRNFQMHISLKKHRDLFFVNKNTEIYTVSNYTKKLLEDTISDISIDKVFYSPLKLQKLKEESFNDYIKEYKIEKYRYFLLSSVSRWTKNNLRAIIVLDGLMTTKQLPEDFKVVLLGCNDTYEKYILKRVKNGERFICKGFVPEVELELLYKYAYSFIYPSLVEGFGYPPIEAMQYGTLSLCSTSTSIPEICGDASIYFNPESMESIKQAILRSLDKKYYDSFSEKMEKHYRELSGRQNNDLNLSIEYLLKLLQST